MISASPSTELSAIEARQFAYALWRQSPSAPSNHTVTCTGVLRPPTPPFPSAPPQTPSSTPQATHDDQHGFVSMCTPTAQLTDLAKEALAKEAGYGIVRIGELSVYAPVDTPQHKLTMQNVVYAGKIASTVQLGPIPIYLCRVHHTCCLRGSNAVLFLTVISLPLLTQGTLIFLTKSCPNGLP